MRKHAGLRYARGVLLFVLATAGCDCGNESSAGDAHDAGSQGELDGRAASCSDGEFRCEGNVAVACGAVATRSDCAASGQSCVDQIGCSECRPGASSCADGLATFCRSDGTLARYECDPEQGLTCTANGCRGECDLSQVYQSYIGCDYYPTVTLNPVWSGFSFAIAVSNTSAQPASLLITRGTTVVQRTTVPAHQLSTFELPWVAELKGGDITCTQPPRAGNSRVADDGAYRVRTDRPVTVYQFSPLQYAKPNPAPAECPTIKGRCAMSQVEQCFSYSNDASLLLPATALTGNYTALAWPSQADGAGFLAITATENGTRVDLTGTGKTLAGGGIGVDGSGTAMLDRGDVLEVVAGDDADLSGTRVRANKPVQLLAGHSCAYVPTKDVQNCDHLEEVVFPEDTLGREYFVTRPVYSDGVSATPYVVRVGAVANDTRVSFDPKVREDVVLSAGRFVELTLPVLPAMAGQPAPNLHVRGDKPLLVTTYMEGQAALGFPGNAGDPSMSTAVPVAQYRSQYLFTAPITYDVNLAAIIAKRGTSVRIDGRELSASDFVQIGSSEYGVANVLLDLAANASGIHEVSASAEVGLTVYGYGQYTSYMYPGGADLERISDPRLYL
jgi:hypothetical protein